MRLRELIERLEEIERDLIDGLGDEVEPEIVAAYQPSWPLTGEVLGACVLHDGDDDEPILTDGQPVVWLAIGEHPDSLSPYAPRRAFEEAE
jgi:hypothetical protein